MHIVTPARMREIEGYAIGQLGIDGLILMERAALSLAQEIRAASPRAVLAICGSGNNGGDAYACARILHLWGIRVDILPLRPVEKLSGDALKNAWICQRLRIPFLENLPDGANYDVVIDGIFGTGLSRAPEGEFAAAIDWINRSGTKVYSVDIPSGVDGATGRVLGCAVRADVTVTFQWAKYGHFLYPGAELCGRLVTAEIGIPDPENWEDAEILDEALLASLLPERPRDAHKNTFGHALLIAGNRGMAGAAMLCTNACQRAGVGLTTVCALENSVAPHLQTRLPAAMCVGLEEDAKHTFPPETGRVIRSALNGKTALGCGCGLGRTLDCARPLEAALAAPLPAVIDADGLYHLATRLDLLDARECETVLTPHPGEMARLLGRPVEDPVKDAQTFAAAHRCVVLLKGACTVIAAPDGRLTFNVIGTSGMATAGSGDALTGIITALLAQGLSAYDAARAGAYLHAQAGLRAEKKFGAASMTAWDISECVRLEGCGID